MPERPLVLFAAPTVADKERRYGGAPKYYFPSHSRQVSRLTPQFNVLQNTMNSGSICLAGIGECDCSAHKTCTNCNVEVRKWLQSEAKVEESEEK